MSSGYWHPLSHKNVNEVSTYVHPRLEVVLLLLGVVLYSIVTRAQHAHHAAHDASRDGIVPWQAKVQVRVSITHNAMEMD
jgi:hypothetical protein